MKIQYIGLRTAQKVVFLLLSSQPSVEMLNMW